MTAEELLALAEAGATLDDQRAAFAAALRERGVSEAGVAGVLEHVRDGIVLRAADDTRASRLGGPGLLPAGEDWPHAAKAHPLTFVAALDLGELPRMAPLPEDGTLLLYWDFEYYERDPMDFLQATRVFWVPPGAELREQPSEKALEPLALRGVAMPVAGEIGKMSEKVGDADHEALVNALYELESDLYSHQLLGSSRDVQGPVLDEIAYWFNEGAAESRERFDAAERTGEGWLLLAQIDEDPAVPGLIFGDAGSLYFVMLEADLRARRFDRVMGIMQCH